MSDRVAEINRLAIPEIEIKNISKFFSAMEKASKELHKKARLEVVGGVLDKPWPRKDIDITVEIEGLNRQLRGSRIDEARTELKEITELVKRASEIDGDFRDYKVKPPYLIHEFEDDPNMLEFDGSIEITPKVGTVLEVMRKHF